MKNTLLHILLIGLLLTACTRNTDTLYLEKAERLYRQNPPDSMVRYFLRVDSNQVIGEAYYTYKRL